MIPSRRENPSDDFPPGLCANCLRIPKEDEGDGSCGRPHLSQKYPTSSSSCPICCNWRVSNPLKGSQNPRHSNNLGPMRILIPRGSCFGCVVEDSRPQSHQFLSTDFESHQKGQFNNINNFKDYQKVYTSSSSIIGRILLAALLIVTLPLTCSMSPPPNYSHANMPKTNFTCSDKATGGYYADPEAGCQMFHVCVRISDDEINDFRFLCPNDTVFDQQNFICTNWWDIDCERSTRYYNKNDLFRVPGEQPTEYEYETPESPVYYEYVYEYADSEGTTEGMVEEETSLGRHRLNLGKDPNETPKGRSIETPFLTTTENPRAIEKTTKILPWRSTSSTVYATTSTSTTRNNSPNSSNIRKNVTPNVFKGSTITSTVSTPISITGPTSYFHFASGAKINASTEAPSNAFEIQRFNSRGGSPFQNIAQEQMHTNEKNETKKSELDSNDPYVNFEWKKDASSVTASARTRYETLFGESQRKVREFSPKDYANMQTSTKSSNEKVISSTPSQIVRRKAPTNHKNKEQQLESSDQNPQVKQNQQHQQQQQHKEQQQQPQQQQEQKLEENEKENQEPSSTKAKHKEFSNFRFYKTAFGRSYSSDDYLGKTGDSAPKIRISDPVRLQRTASRNTRYSVYG